MELDRRLSPCRKLGADCLEVVVLVSPKSEEAAEECTRRGFGSIARSVVRIYWFCHCLKKGSLEGSYNTTAWRLVTFILRLGAVM